MIRLIVAFIGISRAICWIFKGMELCETCMTHLIHVLSAGIWIFISNQLCCNDCQSVCFPLWCDSRSVKESSRAGRVETTVLTFRELGTVIRCQSKCPCIAASKSALHGSPPHLVFPKRSWDEYTDLLLAITVFGALMTLSARPYV